MLGDNQRAKGVLAGWATFWNILSVVAMLALAAFMFTQGSLVYKLMSEYPTLSALAGWGGGMLSYHQDAKRHGLWWAVLSEIFSAACLTALVVLGFRHGAWGNFLIGPALACLQILFTRRWWAKPGAWW